MKFKWINYITKSNSSIDLSLPVFICLGTQYSWRRSSGIQLSRERTMESIKNIAQKCVILNFMADEFAEYALIEAGDATEDDLFVFVI